MFYRIKKIFKNYLSKKIPLSKHVYPIDLDECFQNERLLKKFSKMNLENIFSLMETDKACVAHRVFWHPKKKKNYRKIFLTHGYASYYENFFLNKRQSVNKIIEIGAMSGASAGALAIYFPNAIVYSFDINYERNKLHSSRIKKLIIDQTNTSQIDQFITNENINTGSIDLIIDDGAHTDEAILISLKKLLQYVSKEGYYVIEDLDLKNTKRSIDYLNDKNSDFYKKNIESVEIFKSDQEIDNLDYDTQHYIAFIKPKQ
jgi:precorrin-6B methylase 2